jgi:hypothetical protein
MDEGNTLQGLGPQGLQDTLGAIVTNIYHS